MTGVQTCALPISKFIFNTSCSLERNPLDQFAENEFWTKEENALIALTGIYRGNTIFNSEEYSPSDFWSYSGIMFLEFASDNAYDRRGNNSGFFQMAHRENIGKGKNIAQL